MSRPTTTNRRIAWIDIAKGLAMLAVMADHCGIGLAPLVDYFEVPAFFVLSGLMMKHMDDYGRFAIGKIRRLIVPYIIYNALFIVMFYARDWFALGLFEGVKKSAWGMIVSANYPLWFLKALLWGLLIAGGCVRLRLLDRPAARWAVLLALAAASIGAGSVEWGKYANASCLPQGVIAAALLAAGYCLKRPIANVMARLNGWKALAPALAAIAVGWVIVRGHIGFNHAYIGNAWLFFPYAGIAFAAGALLSRALEIGGNANLIEYIGRNSMNYFCIHAFAIKIAQWAGMTEPWLVLLFTIVTVSVANALIEKCKSLYKA